MQFQELTNTRIIISSETNFANENITIVGKKENIEKAKSEFEAMITDISIVIEDYVDTNKKYLDIVSKQRESLHRLEDDCDAVNILFPLAGTGNKMVLIGSKVNVDLAKQKILDHEKALVCAYKIVNFYNIKLFINVYFLGIFINNVDISKKKLLLKKKNDLFYFSLLKSALHFNVFL